MTERLLTAKQAAERLGVRLETLYAYASRGKLTSLSAGAGAKQRLYPEAEVLRLLRSSQARAGHAAAAVSALDWGQPVLSSSITEIVEAGPRYRGVLAQDLIARGVSFEAACELLWTGAEPSAALCWEAADAQAPATDSRAAARASAQALKREREQRRLFEQRLSTAEQRSPIDVLQLLVPWLALDQRSVHALLPAAELARGRLLLQHMATLVGAGTQRTSTPRRAEPGIAASLAASFGRRSRPRVLRLVNAALVASLDHELNASAFAARVAASAGASLHACVAVGLGTLSGPRHGRSCDRVEALLDEVGHPDNAEQIIAARTERGEAIAGFGHPLYPHGDPRGAALLALAPPSAKQRKLRTLHAVVDAMKRSGRPAPTLDVGLVAIACALGLPVSAAAGLFAIGRTGGWIAHVLEQRERPEILRPRAKFTGA